MFPKSTSTYMYGLIDVKLIIEPKGKRHSVCQRADNINRTTPQYVVSLTPQLH